MLTKKELSAALPQQMKKSVSDELLNKINKTLGDPEELQTYKENLLSYTSVLQKGKFKLENYLNAVRYVGFKMMGLCNREAYIKTFPEKYQDFLTRGVEEKDIASYTSGKR
jgi:hypothetical protein